MSLSNIERAIQYHGHLGPNLVIGAKMAILAKKVLNSDDLFVESEITRKKPTGCINDGLRALCSDVKLVEGKSICATFFSKNKKVRLNLKPEIKEKLKASVKELSEIHGINTRKYFREIEKLGITFWEDYLPEELFDVHGISMHSPVMTKE